MYCWKVKQFKMLLSLLNRNRESALGTQWSTDRDGITPCKTLKHTYYEEAEGSEMWKLHQKTENHHTSYSVPAGHPLISCVCFSNLAATRGKEHNKNSCISWVLERMQNIYCIFWRSLEGFDILFPELFNSLLSSSVLRTKVMLVADTDAYDFYDFMHMYMQHWLWLMSV